MQRLLVAKLGISKFRYLQQLSLVGDVPFRVSTFSRFSHGMKIVIQFKSYYANSMFIQLGFPIVSIPICSTNHYFET